MPASPAHDDSRSVLIVGSEIVPFSKTGGLADVLGALPLALTRLGWDVTIVTPRYRGITAGEPASDLSFTMGGRPMRVGTFEAVISAGQHPVKAVFVDAPEVFDRDGIYAPPGGSDYPDSPRRFAVLAKAALQHAVDAGRRPSVVHLHDWQTGLVPVYLKNQYASTLLSGTPTVFTIHNLAYQGLCSADWLSKVDLPPSVFSPDGAEFWGQLSLLKAGINYASAITTVSPRYALEIQTPELGFGFDGVLSKRSADLSGVLNGIDVEQWDPARDPHLLSQYDASHLDRKEANKRYLLRRLGLPDDAETVRKPLIGMISRMVDQKGLDLLAQIGDALVQLNASFAVLGTGDRKYEDMWRLLNTEHPAKVGVHIGFDEALAHQIEGGADIFLMPSKFEPCGLNQMYSLRYGTVPLVREVGGLADTVHDGKTGFVFKEYSPAAVLKTLRRAIETFGDRAQWKALQTAGMAEDHSWDRSAQEYVRIYERVRRPG